MSEYVYDDHTWYTYDHVVNRQFGSMTARIPQNAGESTHAYRARFRRAWERLHNRRTYAVRTKLMQVTSGMIDADIIIQAHGESKPIEPGGWGVIGWTAKLNDRKETPVYEYQAVCGLGWTDTLAGYESILNALEWAWTQGYSRILVQSSCQIAVNQVYKVWSANLQPEIERAARIRQAQSKFVVLTLEWLHPHGMLRSVELVRQAYRDGCLSGAVSVGAKP